MEAGPRVPSSGSRAFAFARAVYLTLRSIVFFPVGVIGYATTGRTPAAGYQAMIWLFCITGGRFNDWLSSLLSLLRPKVRFETHSGVLGDLGGSRLGELRGRLETDGYLVFERALGDAVTGRLVDFALSTESTIRGSEAAGVRAPNERAIFRPDNLKGVRYDYSEGVLLNNPDVQALLADPSLLSLAQDYLGCRPVADVVNMWWHTNFHHAPDSEAGQIFHFDMDRIKWLKVFIYLTDVGPENGPHTFVRGSHRTGGIPRELLLRGYKRLEDDEVAAQFPASDRRAFTAPRGSIIVEDTRGLHKGANVTGNPRLILQLQFSNCLFGTNYPRSRIERVRSPALERMLSTAPAIYSQYT